MSHGTLGTPSHGRSKALAMGLVLIICPLKEDEPMNFRHAWYAANMMDLKPLHSTLLTLLNQAVSQNFWVSCCQGLGKGFLGKVYRLNFQIFEQVDGNEVTLAAGWPVKLTYMSGASRHLPTELLIQWDLIAQAIQQLLNVNPDLETLSRVRQSRTPELETVEYIRNDDALISYPGDIEDNLPDMLNGEIYNKHVLHSYTETEEGNCKLFL